MLQNHVGPLAPVGGLLTDAVREEETGEYRVVGLGLGAPAEATIVIGCIVPAVTLKVTTAVSCPAHQLPQESVKVPSTSTVTAQYPAW